MHVEVLQASKARAMSQAVIRQSLTTSALSNPAILHARLVVDLTAVGQIFLRLLWIFPIMKIQKILHTYLRFKISLVRSTDT
jgi:hypothetical protein